MNVIDSIPTGDNLIWGLYKEIGKKGAAVSKSKDPNPLDASLLPILIGALFMVVTSEAFKVVLRKNIGKYALSIHGIISAAVMYFIWGWALYSFIDDVDITDHSLYGQFIFNRYILLSGAASYVALGIYILIRGRSELNRPEPDTNDPAIVLYRGDCLFFGNLINKGIPQWKIWVSEEPKACMRLGFIISLIHPLIGIPFLFSAISFKVNEWFHVNYKWNRLQERMDEINIQAKMTGFTQNKITPETPLNTGAQ